MFGYFVLYPNGRIRTIKYLDKKPCSYSDASKNVWLFEKVHESTTGIIMTVMRVFVKILLYFVLDKNPLVFDAETDLWIAGVVLFIIFLANVLFNYSDFISALSEE